MNNCNGCCNGDGPGAATTDLLPENVGIELYQNLLLYPGFELSLTGLFTKGRVLSPRHYVITAIKVAIQSINQLPAIQVANILMC